MVTLDLLCVGTNEKVCRNNAAISFGSSIALLLLITQEQCEGHEVASLSSCSVTVIESISRMWRCTTHTKQVATFAENSNNGCNLVSEARLDAYCTEAS